MPNEYRWETRPHRELERSASPFTEELRTALDRLRDGTLCEECHWRDAAKVIQRRRCVCATCADIAAGDARFARAVERRHGR
jgi:hypothetical protein